MKIIIAGTAYPFRGGLAAYNERLARQFQYEGHDVSIITFTTQYPAFLFPGKSQYLEAPAPSDLRIVKKMSSVNPFSWLLVGIKIKKLRPDVLIIKYWIPFMSPCFSTIARVARSNRHTRVIAIFDNVVPHEKHPGDKFLTKWFVNSIDGAIVMSESVRNDLLKFRINIPVTMNPHPLFDNFGQKIDRKEALARLGLDATYSYLLFFGFIRAYKGLDLLIKAFRWVREEYLETRLIIAGEFYEDEKPYLKMIEEEGLKNDVIIFNRFIKDDEVACFFSACDVVVQPYKHATQSGVTQIAYHFEKPMIVTDVGGLREIVPDGRCGYIVRPDSDALADAIIRFFSERTKIDFPGFIKEEKKKYSWDKMTSK
ncbi:MAG: glycosyltransferase, partial [Bacteroidales bacterium]